MAARRRKWGQGVSNIAIPNTGDFLAALARAVYHVVLSNEVALAFDESLSALWAVRILTGIARHITDVGIV